MMSRNGLYLASVASLIALILVDVAWEGFLAPLRPGGSLLTLKVLPLLALLPGTLRSRRYTFQCASLLIWLYFTEGVVRAWSDHGRSALLAGVEVVLSLIFFVSAILYVRLARQQRSR